jgi:hypothetical protein
MLDSAVKPPGLGTATSKIGPPGLGLCAVWRRQAKQTAQILQPSSKSNAACTEPVPDMIYKWGGTDGRVKCLGVQRTSAANVGGRMVGHDIATEHAGAHNLRQWI